MVGTLFQGMGFVATRAVKDVNCSIMTTWNGLVGTVPPLAVAAALGQLHTLLTLHNILYSLLVGLLSYVGQAMMVVALQVEEAGPVSLIRKADDILLAFAIQIFYFGEIPNPLAAAGASMITGAVVSSGARKIVQLRVRAGWLWLRWLCCLPPATDGDDVDNDDQDSVISHVEEEEEVERR